MLAAAIRLAHASEKILPTPPWSPNRRVGAQPLCRHCGEFLVSRPRGLCWVCYYRPGVRGLYSPLTKHGRRGVGRAICGWLPVPTAARPGTAEELVPRPS